MAYQFFEIGCYPILILPEGLKEYINSGYQPEKPEKPTLTMRCPQLKESSDITISLLFALLIILALPLLLGAIPSAIKGSGDLAGALLPLLIIEVVLILIIKSLMDTDARSKVDYIKSLDLFKKKQTEFEGKMKIYRKQLESYEKHLELLDDLNNSDWEKSEQARLYLKRKFYVSNVTFPIETNNRYKKGYSEDILYSTLKELFGDKIYNNLTLENDLYNIDRKYLPDIVYYSEGSGFVIDIEIDEKYIKGTKNPIHCIDDQNDKSRNDLFTSKGWFVLRFSEDQVLSDLKGCVFTVLYVIGRFDIITYKDRTVYYNMFWKKFGRPTLLEKEKRWTQQDIYKTLTT